MRYSFFKDLNLSTGSGAVESAIRRVINLRLKGAGIFWTAVMAEVMLFLRTNSSATDGISFSTIWSTEHEKFLDSCNGRGYTFFTQPIPLRSLEHRFRQSGQQNTRNVHAILATDD
jgi:hypothetical protein